MQINLSHEDMRNRAIVLVKKYKLFGEEEELLEILGWSLCQLRRWPDSKEKNNKHLVASERHKSASLDCKKLSKYMNQFGNDVTDQARSTLDRQHPTLDIQHQKMKEWVVSASLEGTLNKSVCELLTILEKTAEQESEYHRTRIRRRGTRNPGMQEAVRLLVELWIGAGRSMAASNVAGGKGEVLEFLDDCLQGLWPYARPQLNSALRAARKYLKSKAYT